MAGRSQHRDNRSSYFSSDIGRSGVYDGVNGTPINFSQRGDNPNDLRDTEGISETARESGLYASRIGSTKQPTEDYSKEGMLGSTGNFPRQNWDQSFEEGNRTPESGTYSRNIESNQYDTDYKANNDIGRSSTFDNNRDSGLYSRKIGSFRETIPENSGKDNQRQSSKHFKPNKYIGNTLDTMLEGEDESKQPEHFHSTNYSESRKYSGTARNGDYDGHSNASFQDDKEFPPWAGMMVDQQFTDKYIKTKWPRISLHLTQPRHSDPFVPGKIDEGSIDINSAKDDHKTRNTLCVIGLGTLLLCLVGAAIITVIVLANQSTDKTEYVKVNMTITVEKTFTSELNDPKTTGYKLFASEVCKQTKDVYTSANSTLSGYYGCKVSNLENGSIIVTYIIYFTGTTTQQVTSEAVETILYTHLNVSSSHLGDLKIVTGSVTVYIVETETLSSPPPVEESVTTTTTVITTPHIETTTEVVVTSTVTTSDSETVQTTEATTLNTKQTTMETTSLTTSSTEATTPKTVQTTTDTVISTVPPTEDTMTEPKQSTMETTTSKVPPTEDTTTEPVQSTTAPTSPLISSTEETTLKTVQSTGETSNHSVSFTDETTPKTMHSTTKIITPSSSSTENTTPKTMQTETTSPIMISTVESMSSQSTNHVSDVTTTLQTEKTTEATQETTSIKTTPTKESISSTSQEEPTTLTSTITTSSTDALSDTTTSDSTERTKTSSSVPIIDTTKPVISTSTDDINQLITSPPIDDTTKFITSTPPEETTRLITSTSTEETTSKMPSTSTEYTTHAGDTTKSTTSTSRTKLITSTSTDDTTKPVMSTSTKDTTATVASTAIVDTTKSVRSTPTEDVTQSGTFTSTDETQKPVTSTPTEGTAETMSSAPTKDTTPSITAISTEATTRLVTSTPTEETTTKTVSAIPTEDTTLAITATSTSMSTTGRTTSDEITTVSGTTTESQNIGLNCTDSLDGILYSGPVAISCIIQKSDQFDYIGISHDGGANNSIYGIIVNKDGTPIQNYVENQNIDVKINSTSTINLSLTFLNVSCAMDGFYKVALLTNVSGEIKESISKNIQLKVSSPAQKPILTLNADQVIDLLFPDGNYFRGDKYMHKCEGYVGNPPSNLQIHITYDNGTNFETIPKENIYLNASNLSDGCRNMQVLEFGLRFTQTMVGAKLRCRVKDSIDDFTLSEELSLIPRNICNCAVTKSYRGHPNNCKVQVYCIEEGGIAYPTGIACPANECRNSITGVCTTDCSNSICEETVPSDFCTTPAPPTTTPAPSPYISCIDVSVLINSGPAVVTCTLNHTATFTMVNVTYKKLGESVVQHISTIYDNNTVVMLAMQGNVSISMSDNNVNITILNPSCENEGIFGIIINVNGESVMSQGKFAVLSKASGNATLILHPDQIAGLENYRDWLLHSCEINIGYPAGKIEIEILKEEDAAFNNMNVNFDKTTDVVDNVTCSITRTVEFGILFTSDMDNAIIRCSVQQNSFPNEPIIYSKNVTVSLIPIDLCNGYPTGTVLLPHPQNCKYYVRCENGITYGKLCRDDLCFGIHEINTCNHCFLSTCPSEITTTLQPESTVPVESIDVSCNDSTVQLNTGPGVIACTVNATSFLMMNVTYKNKIGQTPTIVALIHSDGNIADLSNTDLIEVTFTPFTVIISISNVSCTHEGYYGVIVDSGNDLTGKSEGRLATIEKPSGTMDIKLHPEQIIDFTTLRTYNVHTCSGQIGNPAGKIEVEILLDGATNFQTVDPSFSSSTNDTDNCMVRQVFKYLIAFTSGMYNATIRCKITNNEFPSVPSIYSSNETLALVPRDFCIINSNGTKNYPNPSDPCNRYVSCEEDIPYGKACASGECFNPESTGFCGHCYNVDYCP